MTLAYLILMVLILMAVRVPIAFSLLIPSAVYIYFADGISLTIVIQRMTSGINSFPLLAVPLFILMGNIANQTGVTDRLFKFAQHAFGHIKGSLGYVNIAVSVGFSWMSGSAMADAAGLGKIEVPAMIKRGYSERFSVGLTAASSVIGPIMPPSVTAVIYGVVSGVSIGGLFLAGIVPALFIALCLAVVVYFHARRHPELTTQAANRSVIFRSGLNALLPMFTPFIVLGGILGGIFTPTEAAAAAVLYMIALGIIYRKLSFASFGRVLSSTASTTGIVMLIVASASVFGWILGREQVPQQLLMWITSLTDNPLVFLIMLNLALIIIGMILEPNSAILIVVPVIIPAAAYFDISTLQLGSIVILNLMIGLLTPPVGLVLYVLSSVTHISVGKVAMGTLPFLIPLMFVLLVVTFVPAVTLFLPGLFGF